MIEQRNITREEWLINACENPINDAKFKERLLGGNADIKTYLTNKWYEYQRLSLKSYFIDGDIQRSKQYFYECGMIDEIIISKYQGRILEYGMAHISYALLSDNINLIRRYANLAHQGYNKIAEKGSIIHAIQLAITDELSHNYVDILDALSKKKAHATIKPDVKFFRALLNSDKAGCESAIKELLTPRRHNHRNKYMPLTGQFISHPAIGYAKLAWLKDIKVEIDNPLVPYPLLPTSPNAKYDDKFSFLKNEQKGKSRFLKWHEEIFSGVISLAIGITLIFNGFSYMISLFIDENGLHGGPTGQKGLVALFSLVENGWWKYFVVLAFLLIGCIQIRDGIHNHKFEKLFRIKQKPANKHYHP
ncbi:MAG: immunity 49 family protein [Cytophagales bacterium]|nr:immunity 49 family protein [Cytophagales bacterium]